MPNGKIVSGSGHSRLSLRSARRRLFRLLAAVLPVLLALALAGEQGAGTAPQTTATLTAHAAAASPGTIYAHDPDGRVTAVFDASTGTGSKVSYDADGNILSVTPMPATTLAIAQVAPPSGAPGTSVTIYGTDFGSSSSAASVVIGGASATISTISPNEITTTVPSGATGSGLSVTVAGATANAPFTVPAAPPVPTITGLSQQLANPGSILNVSGTGFSADAAMDVASINGTKVAVTSATATALQVMLPPLAVSGQVTVTTPGGTVTSSAEVITTPPPYLAANVGFAGGLTNGTTSTITLSTANQIALALFTVPSGQRASFQVKATIPDKSGEPNQYAIAIFAPNGQQVVQADDEIGLPSPQTWSLPDDSAPGVYEVELVPVNGDTGSFQVTPTAITDPTASMTIGGSAVNIKVSTKGERPHWTFAGTAGQTVYLFWTPPCDCTVQLLSPDGSPVAYDYEADSYLTATLPATGTYAFVMDDELNTGTFTAQVSAIPAAATGSTTVDGTAASLTIASPGQNGVVTFTGTAGQQVFTQASFNPSPLTAGVALVGTDGSLVGQATYQNGSEVAVDTVTLPSTGTYQVQLSELSSANNDGESIGYTGKVTVAVTSAPDVTGSTTVDGPPASLNIAKAGEHGVVTFAGTAGQSVFTQLTMSPAEGTKGTAKLLEEPSGKVLSSRPITGSSGYVDTTALPATGNYEVAVDPVDETGGYTGTITVAVTSVPPPATTTGTYGGAPVPVTTTAPGQDASIAFIGVPASTEVQLSVTATTFPSGMKPYGSLDDPSGSPTSCDGPLAVGVICTVMSAGAGTYTLDIEHTGNGTGTITAQLVADSSGGASAYSPGRSGWGQPSAAALDHPATTSRHPATAYRTPAVSSHPDVTGPTRTRLRYGPPAWSDTRLTRPLAAASLTGRIVTTAGTPLPGVTVSVRGHRVKTDQAGRFDLTGIPQGMQVLEMDGQTASTAHRSFGVLDVQVRLRSGTNRLPFTSYFPVLDTSHEVRITEPLDRNVTLTTPAIPGLRVNLPKGIRITDADGHPVYKIGITAIPVKRTPIPMPLGEQVPVYFTVQPAGGHITHGWATVDYPNYNHAKPGSTLNFWHYNLYGAGWGIYGTGTVDRAGNQVRPDPGTWITDFNGEMLSEGEPNPRKAGWPSSSIRRATQWIRDPACTRRLRLICR